MLTPIASVVMSVFNGERFLREAVESILSQTFRDFEFIIIDDGSTDSTASILDSYARTDRRVQVYPQANRGLVDSLNRGCGLARGKYIARMDGDDIAIKDRLTWQIEFLERHADAGLVGGAVEVIDAAGKTWFTEQYPFNSTDIKGALQLHSPFRHPAVVIRKEVFLSVGGYRCARSFADDYDLFLRMSERCELANLTAVVLKYRIHLNQVTQCHLRQQVMSALAARAAANIRAGGGPDPLWGVEDITPEVLKTLGVTDADIHKAFVGAYSHLVNLAGWTAQAPAALQAFNELLRLAPLQEIPRPTMANGRLAEACIHYREGRLFPALVSAGRAVLARPAIVGRPAKRVLVRLSRRLLS